MPDHKRIQEILDTHLNEAKRSVDVMFKMNGNKSTITYVSKKAKNLPTWVKVGATGDTKTVTALEADWEVYTDAGWEESNGFVTAK